MKTNAKKTTSTALTIPQTITPKPTKNDIINAMVERARVKHAEEFQKMNAAKVAAEEKIKTLAMQEFASNPPKPKITICGWSGSRRVDVEFQVRSPELTKLIATYDGMPTMRGFDEVAVRRQIRDGMGSVKGAAVQALLANPEAVTALDASLAHIGM